MRADAFVRAPSLELKHQCRILVLAAALQERRRLLHRSKLDKYRALSARPPARCVSVLLARSVTLIGSAPP
jgi:hypothetical protein